MIILAIIVKTDHWRNFKVSCYEAVIELEFYCGASSVLLITPASLHKCANSDNKCQLQSLVPSTHEFLTVY